MTSISSMGSSSQVSPRDLLQQELLKEISSGKISSGDKDALSSALDDIDSSLTSGRSGKSAGASKPPSPDEMKAKIDDLISGEVSSGKLTSDQAAELKDVFSAAFAKGPGGAGGPPPGPPPSGGDSASSSSDSSSTSSTDDISKVLQDFLKSLQEQQSKTSTYSASGDTGTASTSIVALLVDYQS